MTKTLAAVGLFCAAFGAAIFAIAASMGPVVVGAGSEKWTPVTGINGLSIVVLYGHPGKADSGVYAERYKASSNVTFPVHWHPNDEEVTVVTGTLLIGFGDKINWSKARSLTAGSFVGIPAKVHHFGLLKAGGVVEVHGNAPDVMNIVK